MEEIKFVPRDEFEARIWGKRSWCLKKKLEVIFDHRDRQKRIRIMLLAVDKAISATDITLEIQARDAMIKVSQIISDAKEIFDTLKAVRHICQKGGDGRYGTH